MFDAAPPPKIEIPAPAIIRPAPEELERYGRANLPGFPTPPPIAAGGAEETGSCLLDGTNDHLVVSSDASLGFGTGAYTVEGWFYFTADTGNLQTLYSMSGSEMQLSFDLTANVAYIYVNGGNSTGLTISVSTGSWLHAAVSRDGSGDNRLFIGGSQIGSAYSNSGDITNSDFWFGENTTGTRDLNAYMGELRISDIARYTSGFTPPSARFTADANTVLLVHCTGPNGSTTFTDDSGNGLTVTAAGNAQVSTAQSPF